MLIGNSLQFFSFAQKQVYCVIIYTAFYSKAYKIYEIFPALEL